ncbi:MAG: hypothetical protein JWL81_338 [Verrucomicrobiales bacterium]|nr:hypothetical protein [Verrucomicrobiales bacterium]
MAFSLEYIKSFILNIQSCPFRNQFTPNNTGRQTVKNRATTAVPATFAKTITPTPDTT